MEFDGTEYNKEHFEEEKMEKSCLNCEFGKPKKLHNGYYCKFMPKPWKDDNGKSMCQTYEPRKETTTKMDKQTAIINHRHMWGWLSENPEKDKRDYMGLFHPGETIQGSCFLCQYAKEHHPWSCKKDCLLIWPGENCQSEESPFNQWEHAAFTPRRAELARQIRDLPEREEERMIGPAGRAVKAHLDGLDNWQPGTIRRRYEVDLTTLENTAAGVKMEVKSPPPKLTRSEAIAKTRKQWRWYARNPDESKGGYFTAHGLERPNEDCYLCEYTRGKCLDTPGIDTCGRNCPLEWPGGACVLNNLRGLYNMWYETDDDSLRISIAWLISRLPEQKE